MSEVNRKRSCFAAASSVCDSAKHNGLVTVGTKSANDAGPQQGPDRFSIFWIQITSPLLRFLRSQLYLCKFLPVPLDELLGDVVSSVVKYSEVYAPKSRVVADAYAAELCDVALSDRLWLRSTFEPR